MIRIRNTYSQVLMCENVLDLLYPIRKLNQIKDNVKSVIHTQIANLTRLLLISNCLTRTNKKTDFVFYLENFFYELKLTFKINTDCCSHFLIKFIISKS